MASWWAIGPFRKIDPPEIDPLGHRLEPVGHRSCSASAPRFSCTGRATPPSVPEIRRFKMSMLDWNTYRQQLIVKVGDDYCSAVEKPAGDSVADHFRLFMTPRRGHHRTSLPYRDCRSRARNQRGWSASEFTLCVVHESRGIPLLMHEYYAVTTPPPDLTHAEVISTPSADPPSSAASLPPPTVLRGSPPNTARPVLICPPGYTLSPGYGCIGPSSSDYTEGYNYWPDYGYGYPFGGFPGFGFGAGRFHRFAGLHGGGFHGRAAFHGAPRFGRFSLGIGHMGGFGRR
jgi:hypothetical protein